VLANENIYLSRKDCNEMITFITEYKPNNLMMAINNGPDAAKPAWAGSLDKEAEHANDCIGAV
jgi:hypothetical protein